MDKASLHHHSCFAMGTRFNAVFPGIKHSHGLFLGKAIDNILKTEEHRLSSFINDSELTVINKEAVLAPFIVSEQMAKILDLCQYYYEKTLKFYDPGLNRLVRQQKIKQSSAFVYQKDEVGGWHDIDWNPESRKLFIRNNRTGIDLGGFGKGWALEKIDFFLKREGVDSAFISFGESSIFTLGSHPLGEYWPLTITHPKSGVAIKLSLKGESVSVSGLKRPTKSGNAEFQAHIFNPYLNTFVYDNRVVIVKTASPLKAEVISTAVMAAGDDKKMEIARNFDDVSIFMCCEDELEFKLI